MDLTKTPGQLATEAADAIRALNHRTLNKDSYDNPSEAGATAYALRTLIERLPQTLTQLGTALGAFDDNDAIRTDDGSDATYSVAECLAAIEGAHEHLGQLLGELAIVSARARTSHMGGHWPTDDEDQDAEQYA